MWFFSLAPAHTDTTSCCLILTQSSSEMPPACARMFFQRRRAPWLMVVSKFKAAARRPTRSPSALTFRLCFGSVHLNQTRHERPDEVHLTSVFFCRLLRCKTLVPFLCCWRPVTQMCYFYKIPDWMPWWLPRLFTLTHVLVSNGTF